MAHVRRLLGRIAVSWLLAHVGAIALSPVVLLVATAATPVECTCAHGDHALCPMHHAPKPGSRNCVIQASGESGLAALGPLFSGVGLPVTPTTLLPLETYDLARRAGSSFTALRPVPPNPPPPRAA